MQQCGAAVDTSPYTDNILDPGLQSACYRHIVELCTPSFDPPLPWTRSRASVEFGERAVVLLRRSALRDFDMVSKRHEVDKARAPLI